MHTPKPPPEAVLLRLARKAAGATVEETARAAGISKAWLSSIENGYDTRTDDGTRPVRAKDEVVARLAAFLHISPGRLETEGERPDAALVLTEMYRQRDEASSEEGDNPRWASLTPRERQLFLALIELMERRNTENGPNEESA